MIEWCFPIKWFDSRTSVRASLILCQYQAQQNILQNSSLFAHKLQHREPIKHCQDSNSSARIVPNIASVLFQFRYYFNIIFFDYNLQSIYFQESLLKHRQQFNSKCLKIYSPQKMRYFPPLGNFSRFQNSLILHTPICSTVILYPHLNGILIYGFTSNRNRQVTFWQYRRWSV